MLIKTGFLINLLFVFAICHSQNSSRDSLILIQPSFEINVSIPPAPVKITGRQQIFYELKVSNFSQKSLAIKKIEVLDAKDSSRLFVFETPEILRRFYKPGVGTEEKDTSTVDPGSFGIVYVELVVSKTPIPAFLYHRITCQVVGANEEEQFFVNGPKTKVVSRSPVKLQAPLKKGPWAAVYEPTWVRGHRRVIYTVDGIARIPGRFAIDFIKLDDSGRFAFKDDNIIKNWYGYNVEVFAVADGVISSTRDDFSESPTLSDQVKYDSRLATGNYISIKISNGQYAFYEHLKPGSILVKPGQRVKKGEVIARVGFTGQSTGPHLHFHLSNRDSPLGAEGLPFVFENFSLLGSYPDFTRFGNARWQRKKSLINQKIKNEFPPPNSVINFN